MKRLTLLALAALASCTVGPNYHRPPPLPAASVVPETFKELLGWQPARPADAADRGPWWAIYNDALLNGLEQRVDAANQTLAQAYAAYRDSQAIVQEARAGLFPIIGANASDTRSHSGGFNTPGSGGIGSATRTSYTAEGTASWTLDVWGQVRRTVESDVANAQSSAALLANARLSAQGSLAADYFNVRAADALAALLTETVSDYQRALEITQNQYAVGVAARSDVLTAQVQLESTQAQLVNVGVARAQYEHAIAVLSGQTPEALRITPGALAANVPVAPKMLPSTLLERRPDIAAAERTMKAQNALIGVAIASYYPVISLSALGGFSGDPLSSLINASNRVWTLAASGTETLFQGGARAAQVAAARATYDESVAAYRQTVLTAFQQVEDQLAALRILEQEATVEADAVRDARHAVAIALNEYRAGTQPYTTVITAQNTALADEQAALTIQQDRLVASVALVQALGGGWTDAALPDRNALQRGIPFLPDALDPTLPARAP